MNKYFAAVSLISEDKVMDVVLLLEAPDDDHAKSVACEAAKLAYPNEGKYDVKTLEPANTDFDQFTIKTTHGRAKVMEEKPRGCY